MRNQIEWFMRHLHVRCAKAENHAALWVWEVSAIMRRRRLLYSWKSNFILNPSYSALHISLESFKFCVNCLRAAQVPFVVVLLKVLFWCFNDFFPRNELHISCLRFRFFSFCVFTPSVQRSHLADVHLLLISNWISSIRLKYTWVTHCSEQCSRCTIVDRNHDMMDILWWRRVKIQWNANQSTSIRRRQMALYKFWYVFVAWWFLINFHQSQNSRDIFCFRLPLCFCIFANLCYFFLHFILSLAGVVFGSVKTSHPSIVLLISSSSYILFDSFNLRAVPFLRSRKHGKLNWTTRLHKTNWTDCVRFAPCSVGWLTCIRLFTAIYRHYIYLMWWQAQKRCSWHSQYFFGKRQQNALSRLNTVRKRFDNGTVHFLHFKFIYFVCFFAIWNSAFFVFPLSSVLAVACLLLDGVLYFASNRFMQYLSCQSLFLSAQSEIADIFKSPIWNDLAAAQVLPNRQFSVR